MWAETVQINLETIVLQRQREVAQQPHFDRTATGEARQLQAAGSMMTRPAGSFGSGAVSTES